MKMRRMVIVVIHINGNAEKHGYLWYQFLLVFLAKLDLKIKGLRIRVWVILDLFEHTRKDFQTEILLVS